MLDRKFLHNITQNMKVAENRYINDEYTLETFIESLNHSIRCCLAFHTPGYARPFFNGKKLFRKYMIDFCIRHNVNYNHMQNGLSSVINKEDLSKRWYFSEIGK